ncbi:hypothetical protein Dimus_033150 [Dionaea muscipula]
MQCSSSLLWSSNSVYSAAFLLSSHSFSLRFRNLSLPSKASPCRIEGRSNFPQSPTPRASSPCCTAIDETVEASSSGSEFIEIGYLYDVHGFQGEICVKHDTDFPELRFSKPGKRWLRRRFSGGVDVQEVDVVSGRSHSKHKSWIVKFDGIDDVDQAMKLLGATLLVKENDRPELDDGEFYSHDLIGMRVILKESHEPVGTVVEVYNYGASDLLRVMLDSSFEVAAHKSESAESGPLVWIPFVEAIVPDVDISKREMQITPPKGLLELNLRSSGSSKKERRVIEWKERKVFQRHLIAAKKKLCAMEQQHVFHGFRFGEKSQRDSLANNITSVNSLLLQRALESISVPFERRNSVGFLNAASTCKSIRHLKTSEDCLASAWKGKLDAQLDLQESGLNLISKGKFAPVLVLTGRKPKLESLHSLVDLNNVEKSPLSILEKLLSDQHRFVEVEQRSVVPVIMISSGLDVQPLKELFLSRDHFGFDSKNVWFLEEEKLPVVSSSMEEPKKHKILMKSPWEILQSPIGSSGILIALSSNGLVDHLIEMGLEYIELCDINHVHSIGNPLVLGFLNSCNADIAIQTMKDATNFEDNFHMILSVKFMKKMMGHIDKLQLHATLKPNSHVELIDGNWIDVDPSSANSYEFESSIYSWLTACSPGKVCLVEVER